MNRWTYWGYNGKVEKNMDLGVYSPSIEYGVYEDLLTKYPEPFSVYLMGTLHPKP